MFSDSDQSATEHERFRYALVKMSYSSRQFKNVYEVYTIDREEDNPNNTSYDPIKHNRNYNKHIFIAKMLDYGKYLIR